MCDGLDDGLVEVLMTGKIAELAFERLLEDLTCILTEKVGRAEELDDGIDPPIAHGGEERYRASIARPVPAGSQSQS